VPACSRDGELLELPPISDVPNARLRADVSRVAALMWEHERVTGQQPAMWNPSR
jgi:hypothetical protein